MNNEIQGIKIVRLQSGEDIIANCISSQDETMILNSPMHIIFKRISASKTAMMMMPWLPIELIKKNEAKIYNSDILTIIDPKDDLVEYYSNSVDCEEMYEVTQKSIRASLFNDEEGDDDEDDDENEEELINLLRERKNSNLH